MSYGFDYKNQSGDDITKLNLIDGINLRAEANKNLHTDDEKTDIMKIQKMADIVYRQMYGCRNGAKFNILKFYSYSTFIHSYSTFVSIQH